MRRPRTRSVGFAIFDGVTALDLTGPLEAFAAANEQFRAATAPYQLGVFAVGKKRVVAESGLILEAHGELAAAPRLDTLIIPGGAGLREPRTNARLCSALRERARDTRRIASVCTGIYGLAPTGLLDGRRVTTHWRFADDVQTRFPKLRIEPDRIHVQDGKFHTSAGVTAGIDLALALIEQDLGTELALVVARELVVYLKRRGGQSQYSAPLQLQSASVDRFEELGFFIREHLHEELSVELLAHQAALSPRQFTRRFTQATGRPPAAYVLELRTEEARRLLLEGSSNVGDIATCVGFKSDDVFRRAFERRFGLGPREYRARFGAASDTDRAKNQ
jgi:transcriptional regulator GlxA family with amidase domain